MKRTGLLLLSMVGFAAMASTPVDVRYQLPANFDTWNLNFKLPLDKLEVPASTTPAPRSRVVKNTLARVEGESEATEFFVAGQCYHKDYQFYYDGGAIATYNIGVKVDGTKVIISNLFNLEAQSTEWSKGVDYDIEGVYDAAAHTITIPTSSNFNNATYAGTIGDYYTCVLACGEVTTDGKMAPADELVLNVNDDFTEISTETSFGIINYTNDGSTAYGAQTLYRRFYANIPQDEPKLIAFNNSFDMGESYPDYDVTKTLPVVNVSNADADFAITMESDDDSFSSQPEAGVIDAKSICEVAFTFNAHEPGDYEGLASLEYDSDAADAKPIEVLFMGSVKPFPDYTPIVKNGEFDFKTSLEYPFEITTLEDGTTVARSTINGRYGNSQFDVIFDVPEGNIATLSWKGHSTNTGYWYNNAGGVFVDNLDTPWAAETGDADIDNTYDFAPGKHTVRFQYDGYNYTGDEKNGLYVYDLDLQTAPAEANKAEIETPEVNFGNFMLRDGNPVEGQGVIIIRNRGTETLAVSEVSTDNSAFTAVKPSSTAGLLEAIEIPVYFSTTTPGSYTGTITVKTNSGDFTAEGNALVRQMADFSTIVTEGADLITSYNTDESNPFEVENGVAYNANSGEADNVATQSWFQIDFTVPEGKVADIEWDGYCYGSSPNPDSYWDGDYGYFDVMHPMASGGKQLYGDAPASHEDVFLSDEFWTTYLTCIPGDHHMKFQFNKNGDGIISEKDRLEISNFRLVLRDFPEHGVEADIEDVTFDEIYVGPNRHATATVTLKNTGSAALEVTGVDGEAPFYGIVPDYAIAQFNGTVQVGLWFFPTEEGEYNGTVTFHTNAGDVVINCHGKTLEGEGCLLIGDVEDEAYGWSFYDADKDGDCWNLGYNLWGNAPEWCHGGNDCFGSPSYTYYGGPIEPDNWLFSPIVEIPEDGAMLRWYAASHHHDRYAENYSVYVATPEELADVNNLNNLEAVFSETLEAISADEWQERTVDLADYAGKQVQICFRHHDCNGQYVLKIDDIFVYDRNKWEEIIGSVSVDDILANGEIVKSEIYDVNGVRHSSLVEGINIIRNTYTDGTVKTVKLVVKK